MSVEDISDIWAKDATIDDTNLAQAAKRIPELHNKYYTMYYNESYGE